MKKVQFNQLSPELINCVKTGNRLKLLGGLSILLLIFTMTAVATSTDEYATAGAYASAVGTDSASTYTIVSIAGDEITSSADATATSSNGGTAQATADVWANFKDYIYAHAWSIATVVSGIGQKSEAHAHASVTIYNGMATAGANVVGTGDSVTTHSGSFVNTNGGGNSGSGNPAGAGNGGNGDPAGGGNGDPVSGGGNTGNNNNNNAGNNNGDNSNGNNNNINNQHIIQPQETQENRGFFGFVFCNSDVCAYSYFKHQYEQATKSDNNINELRLADYTNNSYIAKRAKYYMEIIASDRGLNESQFESKYKVDTVPMIGTDRT